MRKLIIIILLLFLLPVTARATEITPPVPDGLGEKYMPDNTESFAEGLWSILLDGIALLEPAIAEAAKTCAALIAAVLLLSLADILSDHGQIYQFISTVLIAVILLTPTNSLVRMASETVRQISDYGKLLVPILTGTVAAQGEAVTSTVLYTGTVIFDSILSGLIAAVLTPLVYVYLILSIGNSATGVSSLSGLRDLVKWLMTWGLKITLYVFTGYMSITKVVSGSTDAAALKAAKLTISGVVPVVGGIISDASESILVSARLVKNSVGIYGLLAIAAMWLEPFVTIGVQYLLLKGSAALCGLFGMKRSVDLIKSFTTAMGFLVAMTGAVCLMLLISIICFMKGVS